MGKKKTRKKKVLLQTSLLGVLVLCAGCGGAGSTPSEQDGGENSGVVMFAEYTACDLFAEVPALLTGICQVGSAEEYGGGTYVLDVNGGTMEDYRGYLELLEEEGFEKYADNGEDGLGQSVYTADFTKGDLVLNVTHIAKHDKTYISACEGLPLSGHLRYDEKYVADNLEGAQTTLSLVELHDWGNSFVIRLKNGHFLLNDGGNDVDLPYLIAYLESLAPEGEKPVIEAWMISHAHADHMGAFVALGSSEEYLNRVYVEGVYFNESSATLHTEMEWNEERRNMRSLEGAAGMMLTTEGTAPQVYRMKTGHRYYFNDTTVEVVLTQEQMVYKEMDTKQNYNDMSTWLMYNIEGQKILVAGDTYLGPINIAMSIYDKEYFDLDVYATFHHGTNIFDCFTDFSTPTTVLYTVYGTESLHATGTLHHGAENEHLQEVAQESLSWSDGTKVLTFPYQVGTFESLPLTEWIYGEEERVLRLNEGEAS